MVQNISRREKLLAVKHSIWLWWAWSAISYSNQPKIPCTHIYWKGEQLWRNTLHSICVCHCSCYNIPFHMPIFRPNWLHWIRFLFTKIIRYPENMFAHLKWFNKRKKAMDWLANDGSDCTCHFHIIQ